jgi:hypothetical protein
LKRKGQNGHIYQAMKWCSKFIFLFGLLVAWQVRGQTFERLQVLGGPGNEIMEDLTCGPDGSCFMLATFEQQISIGPRNLNGRGGSDLLLLKKTGTGSYNYFTHAGGPLDEEGISIRVRSNGEVLCAGNFWRELVFPDTTLRARENGKASFLALFSANGKLLKAQIFDGPGLKTISDMALGPDGTCYLGGYFGDTLFVGKNNWISRGETDGLLAAFGPRLELKWLKQYGGKRQTQVTGLTFTSQGPVLCGHFDGTIYVQKDSMLANTNDADTWVLAAKPNGELRWFIKGGGVFDSFAVDIQSDALGQTYICGNLVGQIRFGNGLSMQSGDRSFDVFLYALTPEGVPFLARTFTGEQGQEAASMLLYRSLIYICGYSAGPFRWDQQVLNNHNLTGFIGVCDSLGRGRNIRAINASESLFPNVLAADARQSLLLGGVYRGQGTIDGLAFVAASSFNLFVLETPAVITANRELRSQDLGFSVFPNPFEQELQIESKNQKANDLVLFDAWGRKLQVWHNEKSIQLAAWPAGVYYLQIWEAGKFQVFQLLKGGEKL